MRGWSFNPENYSKYVTDEEIKQEIRMKTVRVVVAVIEAVNEKGEPII